MPRFYCPFPLEIGAVLELPPGVARHVQVLRLQPQECITLFHDAHWGPGEANECEARITTMGRSAVQVRVEVLRSVPAESLRRVHLAVGVPANERMDWLVEKATELGVASIQPLLCAHSVLRLQGERAEKRREHWQAIAVSATEQSGANRVPVIHLPKAFANWLQDPGPESMRKDILLSLHSAARPLAAAMETGLAPSDSALKHTEAMPLRILSGPEGGLSESEESTALAAGFCAVSLGQRVLRAETAALAALARVLI